MKVILAENEDAEKIFENVINRVAERVIRHMETKFQQVAKKGSDDEDGLWVDKEEAKKILKVKSKKKLQRLRDQNLIKTTRYGRTIQYYKPSLYDFLERNVQE